MNLFDSPHPPPFPLPICVNVSLWRSQKRTRQPEPHTSHIINTANFGGRRGVKYPNQSHLLCDDPHPRRPCQVGQLSCHVLPCPCPKGNVCRLQTWGPRNNYTGRATRMLDAGAHFVQTSFPTTPTLFPSTYSVRTPLSSSRPLSPLPNTTCGPPPPGNTIMDPCAIPPTR